MLSVLLSSSIGNEVCGRWNAGGRIYAGTAFFVWKLLMHALRCMSSSNHLTMIICDVEGEVQ